MLVTIIVVLILLILIVASVRPISSQLSDFELQRRVDDGDKNALKLWRRKDLHRSVISLQLSLKLIMLVGLALLASSQLGAVWGMVLTVAVGLWHHQPARLVHGLTQPQYRKYEAKVLSLVEVLRPILATTYRLEQSANAPERIASRQELMHVITKTSDLTSIAERSLMVGALRYEQELVKDHMTTRGVISSVAAEELIGPLVLDDLHKTGQSSFPVRDGDVDHIIGILHIHDLINLNNKTSASARDLMTHSVQYIDQEATIAKALEVLAKTQAALLIATDKSKRTTGVLTLADVEKVLLDSRA